MESIHRLNSLHSTAIKLQIFYIFLYRRQTDPIKCEWDFISRVIGDQLHANVRHRMSMSLTDSEQENCSLCVFVCIDVVCVLDTIVSTQHTRLHLELHRLRPLTQRLHSRRIIVGTNTSLTGKQAETIYSIQFVHRNRHTVRWCILFSILHFCSF